MQKLKSKQVKNKPPRQAGPLLGWSKNMKEIYYSAEDVHSIVVGATRCGKTRHQVLESVGLIGMAGESMVITDPKSELYLYTYPFLERLGYEIITLDFIEPKKSNHYNFLQPVLDAVNMGDLSKAVTWAQNISNLLLPDKENTSTDPIWGMGARAILTVSILVVCIKFQDNPEWQNLSNCRYFIGKMCVPGPKGESPPIVTYLQKEPNGSPMQTALDIANIAPDKMQCSFYAEALTALDKFHDVNIHSMTSLTDFDCTATGDRKRAIFIILPDEQSAYYPIASLFVFQQYQLLVGRARENGGRLPRRVQFLCDEFGNFAKIPDWDKAITAGAGRGIRIHMYIQDYQQIYNIYGDKLGRTIVANCEVCTYLKSDDAETQKAIVQRLDKYTVKSPSLSASTGGNSSASYNLTGRDLLTISELQRIRRPYQLVMSSFDPVVMYAPDISKTFFNELFGMGDKNHNIRLQKYRSDKRQDQAIEKSYWDGRPDYHFDQPDD